MTSSTTPRSSTTSRHERTCPLRGLLLSGGFSTRMGQDKGSLIWQDAPLIQRQMRLLRSVTDEVLISCREEQRNAYSSHGDLLIDQLPPRAPSPDC